MKINLQRTEKQNYQYYMDMSRKAGLGESRKKDKGE